MENLPVYLSSILHHMHWFWLGLAIFLGILDIILGTSFFLIWLGLVSLIVGMLVWMIPSIGLAFEFLLFAMGSLASTLLWRRFIQHNPTHTDRPHLNRRSEQYIGRTFTLIEHMENGRGKIRVEDSTWQVEGPDLPAGTKVRVVAAHGVILKVVPTQSE